MDEKVYSLISCLLILCGDDCDNDYHGILSAALLILQRKVAKMRSFNKQTGQCVCHPSGQEHVHLN